MKRFLGIDYGAKRIGLAISDENGVLAFPKEIAQNNPLVFKRIGEIIKAENVSEIVMGESTDFSGQPNAVAAEIGAFAEKLEKEFNLPVHKQKEFLTSVEARRHQDFGGQARQHRKEKYADASAAALILQRYLDRINSTGIRS